MDASKIGELIDAEGFECKGTLDPKGLVTLQDVRDACAVDKCQHYDKCWACPPACGTIEEYESKMHEYSNGYVFQTVVILESTLDWEGISAAMENHENRVRALADTIAAQAGDEPYMLLTAGSCTLCKECTYPDKPCRFPSKRLTSMEAAGLNVTNTCKLAQIPYNHGKNSLAYSSCVLFN
mgnify:CR=1 FL=1